MSASSDDLLNANSSGGSWPVSSSLQGIDGSETIDTIWNAVILGESKFNSEKTCYDLADEYRRSGKTVKKRVEKFRGCPRSFMDLGWRDGLKALPHQGKAARSVGRIFCCRRHCQNGG